MLAEEKNNRCARTYITEFAAFPATDSRGVSMRSGAVVLYKMDTLLLSHLSIVHFSHCISLFRFLLMQVLVGILAGGTE
jgi:hypothetical protein